MIKFYAVMTGISFGLMPVYPVQATMIMFIVCIGSMIRKGESV